MKKFSIETYSMIGIAVGFLLLFGVVTMFSKQIPQGNSKTSEIVGQDWVKGNKDGEVQIIEYSDLQCPACAYYSGFSEQLEKDFGDKVAFVYRHFPLASIHRNSTSAAMSAEAAGRQGKFWEMHDLLFSTQQIWSKSLNLAQALESYALELGLDIDQYRRDIISKEVSTKINSDIQKGNLSGVSATPTFMLNGSKITNPKNYESFKELISKEVNKNE